MESTLIGIDLAKSIFHLCVMDQKGHVAGRQKLTREKLLEFLANTPPSVVAMEACGGSHYWARKAREYGHTARLISGQFVKPFVKSNKNDVADAEAIAEAASRPTMRYVPVKTVEQQDIQAVHRYREQLVKMRTALSNQCRGLLLENGIVVPKGHVHLKGHLPVILEPSADSPLSPMFRTLLQSLSEHLEDLEKRLETTEKQILELSKAIEPCQRLQSIPGIGPITATALFAAVGTGTDFKNGRQMAAWLGLVPKQDSTGGTPRLLGISKRGDKYLRKLLIHGGRSVLIARSNKSHTRAWAKDVSARAGHNKAAVALANKNARIALALLRSGESFRDSKRDTTADTEHQEKAA